MLQLLGGKGQTGGLRLSECNTEWGGGEAAGFLGLIPGPGQPAATEVTLGSGVGTGMHPLD